MDESSCHALEIADMPGLVGALDLAGLPSGDVQLPGRRFFGFADGGGPVGYGRRSRSAPRGCTC